jgi:putative transcriptional regulator
MNKPRVDNAVLKARIRKGMTQQELADLVGLARQSIISIEKGRFLPTIENALRIAAALEVPVQELFWLSKDGS